MLKSISLDMCVSVRVEYSARLEAILLDIQVLCVSNRVRDLKSIFLDMCVSVGAE